MGFRDHQDGWDSKVFLGIFENFLHFFSPLELVLFF
jgi:hypothetical protein